MQYGEKQAIRCIKGRKEKNVVKMLENSVQLLYHCCVKIAQSCAT